MLLTTAPGTYPAYQEQSDLILNIHLFISTLDLYFLPNFVSFSFVVFFFYFLSKTGVPPPNSTRQPILDS